MENSSLPLNGRKHEGGKGGERVQDLIILLKEPSNLVDLKSFWIKRPPWTWTNIRLSPGSYIMLKKKRLGGSLLVFAQGGNSFLNPFARRRRTSFSPWGMNRLPYT